MKNYKLIVALFLGLFFANILFAQNDQNEIHPLSKSILFSLEVGGNYPLTDYETPDFGLSFGGSMEYYFPTESQNIFGLKLGMSQQTLSGRGNNLGFKNLSQDFETLTRRAGLGIIYSYSVNDQMMPFVSAGISYMWLGFLSEAQRSTFYDLTNGGEKNSLSFDFTGGLKIKINNDFDINIGLTYHYLQNDNLDAVKYGEFEDFYVTGLVGFSYRLWNERDSDDDGIIDDEDNCPYQAEDLDGYQDYDGCPDPDNDGDGILDFDDACQNIAEDLDGYQDEDGCPDLDNDGDGVADTEDGCPNIPEDFDGFEDEDGCPDSDNDKDGIVDSKDKCPNEAEVFNGYQDDDGCPDVAPEPVVIEQPKPVRTTPKKPKTTSPPKTRSSRAPSQFLIHAETTFSSNSSQIKSSAFGELNRIVAELRKYPRVNWRIEGHIDKQGSRADATRITKSQADAILSYFISKGLSASNFQSIGFGDSTPIASNSSVYGKMKNRRIIIRKVD